MRIVDENDVEIQESDVDLEKGYVINDRIFVQHHDAVEGKDAVVHYEAKTFYFEDGSSLDVAGNTDPHVEVVDEKQGIFNYVDVDGSGKVYHGLDLTTVEDEPAVQPKDAYDEYEDVRRYVLYTEQELAAREAEKNIAAQQSLQESQIANIATMFAATFAMTATDEELLSISSFVPEWEVGATYKIGDVRQYNSDLYRALADSTAEAHFPPDVYTSGWKKIQPPTEDGVYPWEQPLGSTDAYMKGDKVYFNGYIWESVIDYNVWSPSVYPAGWTKSTGGSTVDPDPGTDPETEEYPEWKQPAGAHDAYQIGDKVSYNGKHYECTSANNVYAPDVYGWKEI